MKSFKIFQTANEYVVENTTPEPLFKELRLRFTSDGACTMMELSSDQLGLSVSTDSALRRQFKGIADEGLGLDEIFSTMRITPHKVSQFILKFHELEPLPF